MRRKGSQSRPKRPIISACPASQTLCSLGDRSGCVDTEVSASLVALPQQRGLIRILPQPRATSSTVAAVRGGAASTARVSPARPTSTACGAGARSGNVPLGGSTAKRARRAFGSGDSELRRREELLQYGFFSGSISWAGLLYAEYNIDTNSSIQWSWKSPHRSRNSRWSFLSRDSSRG